MASALKVLVALSGGVDSSASLALLHEQKQALGIERLEAAYIKTWMHEENPIGECSWKEDIADAQAVCDQLGVPFRVINLIGEYEKHVVKMLVDGYAHGITPNPDIACNRFIKFGAFLNFALAEGFTHVATGHYARIQKNKEANNQKGVGGEATEIFHLLEGRDPNKDQSYFLAQLNQSQLSHALFPIGDLLKPDVREIAKKFNLPNHAKKDSQGICFLGRVKINDFLRRYLPDKPGPIINAEGREVGQHKGLHHHTIGQRHGMGIPSNKDGEHYVVIAKDFETNTLRVAFDHPTTAGLYQQTMKLHHIHSVTGRDISAMPDISLLARPRYRDPKVPITLKFGENPQNSQEASLSFATPQRALASGQIVAFYDKEELIGSGVYV